MCSKGNLTSSPIIWKEFTKGDQKYWIQSVEDEHVDTIVHGMINDFFRDEPIGKYSNLPDDLNFTQREKLAYLNILKQKLSVVCLTNVDGKPKIAGFFCLEIAPASLNLDELCIPQLCVNYFLTLRNICTDMGVTEYLADRGLFVFPEFRGQDIGCNLLQCWPLVCKHVGMKLGLGVFSSKFSQAAAQRAGLLELHSIPYQEIRKVLPQCAPLGIEAHTKNLMLFCVLP